RPRRLPLPARVGARISGRLRARRDDGPRRAGRHSLALPGRRQRGYARRGQAVTRGELPAAPDFEPLAPRTLRIRELPSDERPREKLQARGASALSDAELLAILVNTGPPGESVTSMCQRIMGEFGGDLYGLMRSDLDALVKIRGVGPAKAVTILAAIELGRRIAQVAPSGRQQVRTPEVLARIFEPRLLARDHEELWVAVLDTNHQLVRLVSVYQASVNSAQVRTAEIFKEAVRANAPAIALA